MIRSFQSSLTENVRKALTRGLFIAGVTLSLYLLIVVVTTPSLPPGAAISAAFSANSIVIFGTALGVGAQTFFWSYSRTLGCRLNRKELGGGSSGTVLGSFFSFFSLVPLGCCGTWLVVLSFLPSIFGSALSGFLIDYSRPLSYAAFATVLGFAALSGTKLYRTTRSEEAKSI